MDEIKRIKKKLETLKVLDQGYSIFGSSKHKYQFNPVLSEEQILEIENVNEIILSEEFKEILKYLGNGGAGCGYGLEPLNLERIKPPYIGTKHLLRNWGDTSKKGPDMVNIDEVSGIIKLFDYGCGIETCLIVNGQEECNLITFDCDGFFQKLENQSLLSLYENWLDDSINVLQRIEDKLNSLTIQEVIDSEWKLKNFSVKSMISSLQMRP